MSTAADGRAPRSTAAVLLVLLVGVLAVAGLCALGIWQVHRRAWKLDLIARVNSRVHAAPAAPPGPDQWPRISAERNEYQRVRIAGRLLTGLDTRVQAVSALGGGFWVITPLATDAGYRVLVNRGFVPSGWRENAREGPVVVTGLLRMSEPGGGFLRRNDPAHDRWFSRDVAAIALARGVGRVAPYFVDADATAAADAPVGGLTVIRFPNNHLIYAITWFGLALMAACGTAMFAREEWRARHAGARDC